jgi:hypothetical protein
VPCTKRAPTNMDWLWAEPQASEASVNSVTPARKTFLRPMRSPRRPEAAARHLRARYQRKYPIRAKTHVQVDPQLSGTTPARPTVSSTDEKVLTPPT